jgi:hypothetical protein
MRSVLTRAGTSAGTEDRGLDSVVHSTLAAVGESRFSSWNMNDPDNIALYCFSYHAGRRCPDIRGSGVEIWKKEISELVHEFAWRSTLEYSDPRSRPLTTARVVDLNNTPKNAEQRAEESRVLFLSQQTLKRLLHFYDADGQSLGTMTVLDFLEACAPCPDKDERPALVCKWNFITDASVHPSPTLTPKPSKCRRSDISRLCQLVDKEFDNAQKSVTKIISTLHCPQSVFDGCRHKKPRHKSNWWVKLALYTRWRGWTLGGLTQEGVYCNTSDDPPPPDEELPEDPQPPDTGGGGTSTPPDTGAGGSGGRGVPTEYSPGEHPTGMREPS